MTPRFTPSSTTLLTAIIGPRRAAYSPGYTAPVVAVIPPFSAQLPDNVHALQSTPELPSTADLSPSGSFVRRRTAGSPTALGQTVDMVWRATFTNAGGCRVMLFGLTPGSVIDRTTHA